MALAAMNAWQSAFPSMLWLYCGFHVDKALRTMLLKMKAPEGISATEFSEYRGQLINEVHLLVCGEKDKRVPTQEEFVSRASIVSELLWMLGAAPEAANWDMYVATQERWAPYARRDAMLRLFGDADFNPMLSRTNNVLESFFRVLKRVLLRGVTCMTMFRLIHVWEMHQSRIVINLTKVGLNIACDGLCSLERREREERESR